jgi:DnaJ domain
VRYQRVRCPLDRDKLAHYGAWWRGVCFVSRQDGGAAGFFWAQWQERFGHLEPLRMPLDQARQLLGVSENYSREEVIKAFRKLALKHHPDHGGDADMLRKLVEARDLLLALIGTKAEAGAGEGADPLPFGCSGDVSRLAPKRTASHRRQRQAPDSISVAPLILDAAAADSPQVAHTLSEE